MQKKILIKLSVRFQGGSHNIHMKNCLRKKYFTWEKKNLKTDQHDDGLKKTQLKKELRRSLVRI